jgi:hypothetical protein
MTVSSTQNRSLYAGDGATVTFDIGFTFSYLADGVTPAVGVYTVAPTTGVITHEALGTDYTVDPSTPSVTFGTAPVSGATVLLLSAVPAIQPSVFLNQGFLPSTVESALDWTTLALQDVGAALPLSPGLVSALPALAAPGDRRWVTDSTAPTFGAAVVGGGTGRPLTPVFYDGLAWRWG